MNYQPGAQPGPNYEHAAAAQPLAPLKHSGLGIASFIMSILALIGYFAAFFLIIAAIGQAIDNPANIEEALKHSSAAILGVIAIFGAGIINLIALILGIVGLVLKNRKKVFAIIGTVLSSLSVVMIIYFYIVGTMQQV
ncbi:hypothetical protein [Paenibacillus woosongensis]|uniref:Uncharacterized protein n=1 Tax=Paenibacillus woosongensis TaxID=307580 RepID=A0A7X3CLN6_9BACL|nr:hypothetical protein [Paenibacillus woosongensis]MUG43859.1 hypothetical protein [Paenibacillus woosongensis]